MLTLNHVNIAYNDFVAVKDFSLSFDKTSYGIVGESGSGKSTLINGILKLLPASATIQGEILYQGKDLLQMSQEEFRPYRWQDFAVVFQGAMNYLSPVHKIGPQLFDMYRAHNKKLPSKQVKEHILSLFREVQLPENIYTMYPHQLSGGMMQRVAIAQSILFHPSVLIFDEATTALDVMVENQILSMVQCLGKKRDLLTLVITHDVSVVSAICERVLVMHNGVLLEEGLVSDVFSSPQHPYTKSLLQSYQSLEKGGQ